ncbi:MAG: FecR family protein [Lachnospiraceae bacterium]|nr:FecR family protein [Lachnospiraceae bacterium]
MKKRILSVMLILVIMCTMIAGCGRNKASTMRILRYEGIVRLQDSGKYKKIKEEMRLKSGNLLSTYVYSSACVGLDDEKIVTMDQNSEAVFKQSGKKLEMDMTKGSMFFEVKKPLEEDEAFEITTSTMIVGIRGTSGYIEILEDGSEKLIVTDGSVHVILTNPVTGEVKETDVSAGQELQVYRFDDREIDSIDFNLVDVYNDIFPTLARNYILENDELKEKISADIGEDKLDEILWDEEIGYEPSPKSYGSYASLQDVVTALEQLEMVLRISSFALNRDAEGLETYLESKSVPGAEYITDFGMRILNSIK